MGENYRYLGDFSAILRSRLLASTEEYGLGDLPPPGISVALSPLQPLCPAHTRSQEVKTWKRRQWRVRWPRGSMGPQHQESPRGRLSTSSGLLPSHAPGSLSQKSPNAFHHLCWPRGAWKGKGDRDGPKPLGVTLWHSRLGLLCRCHLISSGLRKRRGPAGGWSLGWDKERE